MTIRRIVRGGLVLDAVSRSAPHRDILISDGRIAEIGSPGMPAPEDAEPVDATDRLLVPGLVNAHVHAHGTLAKGLCGDRWPLELLLNANPALNRGRATEEKYLCGLLNAVELVRRGCTTCCDMFAEFPVPSVEGVHAVARAYRDVGIRAVVAPMVADRTFYQAIPGLLEALPEHLRDEVAAISAAPRRVSLDVCREICNGWPFDRDFLRPGVAPTIPLHCSDEFLIECAALSRDYGLALQTHLAETRVQSLSGTKRYGYSLTTHLSRLGVLSPLVSAAHAIWIDEQDIRLLADSGTSVVHNPLSNARLGSGIANVRSLVKGGVNVGIGTDATNSSDSLNMFEATRWASYLSRLRDPETTNWLGSGDVFSMATRGSAKAIGFHDAGALEPGFHADIVFLDLTHITYLPQNDLLRQVVFAESGASVASVMIGGKVVLWNGAMQTIDERRLRSDAQAASDRLRATNRDVLAFAEGLETYVGAFCSSLRRATNDTVACDGHPHNE